MSDEGLVAVTAIGTDRPGIVAAVTEVLFDVGCNLEDVTSTILRGHFTMVLTVRVPEGVDAEELERRLAVVAADLELVITARPVAEAPGEVAAPTHMISVYGSDRPGLVFRVSKLLADAGVNITDLSSRLIGSEQRPVYALMLEVVVPAEVDIAEDLDRLKDELGVEVSIHTIEADLL